MLYVNSQTYPSGYLCIHYVDDANRKRRLVLRVEDVRKLDDAVTSFLDAHDV